MRKCTLFGIPVILATMAFGQSSEKFEVADVHVSAKAQNMFVRSGPARGGRYEVKMANMVDLVRIAYGFDYDKILGGPSWVEMDRYDVIGKVPPDSNADSHKLMLQALLAERFKLVVHKDTKPLPTYALVVGKKSQLKEADGSGDTGCKPQAASGPPLEGGGGMRLSTSGPDGKMTTINLGPGMVIQFECRNMSMAAFAAGLRGMMGSNIGPNPVLDETGLKGNYNFDVKWSMQLMGPMAGPGDRISVFDAVEKQLGLKLEQRPVPTPVLVIDSAERVPTENSPEVAKVLPPVTVPTEFEVTDVKITSPDVKMSRMNMQPGGRFVSQGMPLRFLLTRAFNTNNMEEIVGLPKWADTDRFDINAKAPSMGPGAPPIDFESIGPMLRALMVDRFKMKYHTEERPITAYTLVAGKPKMKKADPASRTFCKQGTAPAGAPPGSVLMTCQNISMPQFAERLQNAAQQLNWPVVDATAIEGGWDFALTYTRFNLAMATGPGRGGEGGAPGGDLLSAADPSGAVTIFDAVEKQLGLKLEPHKRPLPVVVIDSIEQKPTEN